MTPKLESSVVLAKDLKDQPMSSYVLLVGAGRPQYYAVDTMETGGCYDDIAEFYLAGDPSCNGMKKLVYACRLNEGAWAMVSRDAIEVVTEKEYTQGQHKDAKAQEEFYNALDPEAWKEAKELATHLHAQSIGGAPMIMGGEAGARGPKDDGKPVPGQYL